MARPTYVRYTGIRSFDVALARLGDHWHGTFAVVITGVLFLCVTWGVAAVGDYLNGRRPPLVYFLIPIAFAAATLGRRAGLVVTFVASILACIFVVTDSKISTYHFAGVD